MYKILGADGKEYGPVTAEVLTQWIRDGRAGANTMVLSEGASQWKPLGELPEFMALVPSRSAPQPPPLFASAQPLSVEQLIARHCDLDPVDCIRKGWTLMMENAGLFLGVVVILILIQMALGAGTRIPLVGSLFHVASLVLGGPMTAGFYWVLLKRIRGQPAQVGDMFAGFGPRFLQILVTNLLVLLYMALSAIPGGILMALGFWKFGIHNGTGIGLLIAGGVIALPPTIYCSICWYFAALLALDKELDFKNAMRLSRGVINRHFGQTLILFILMALVNVCGVLACCVGMLFSIPVGIGAMMYAYEIFFSNTAETVA